MSTVMKKISHLVGWEKGETRKVKGITVSMTSANLGI